MHSGRGHYGGGDKTVPKRLKGCSMVHCRKFSESTAVLQTSNHCCTGYEFGKIAVDELNLRQKHYFIMLENLNR